MDLKDLNTKSRAVAETLFRRFPFLAEFAEIYVPVSDSDRESDAGSLYIDFPLKAESWLDRLTAHHRGDCFEIGCYYNGAKMPEEFQLYDDAAESDGSSVADFIEQFFGFPPDGLIKEKNNARKLSG